MEKIAIITGGNKGIGEGIALAYQKEGYHIYAIARSKNLSPNFTEISQIEFDLTKSGEIENILSQLFEQLDSNKVKKLVLVNNAGTLGEINKTVQLNSIDIAKTVQLNITAPIILTAIFLKLSQNWKAEKTIINISSGAATKPYSGWTVYCATKAALDMMTKTIALEQETLPNGAKIMSVYPGVVDTDMQSKIRQSTRENFASIDRFLELKASNSLADPKTVGQQIFTTATDVSVTNGAIIRIEG